MSSSYLEPSLEIEIILDLFRGIKDKLRLFAGVLDKMNSNCEDHLECSPINPNHFF